MRRLYTFYFALLMLLMVFVSIETGWAQSATFFCINGPQSLVVPNGVFTIHIEAYGAEGGGEVAGFGGRGGFARGDLQVIPGETLDIFVGCAGGLVGSGNSPGGFNGGGTGNANTNPGFGGGGGASDVRQGGDTVGFRVIVAGGGGGGCPTNADIGGDGAWTDGLPGVGSGVGLGGTQAAGGDGFNFGTGVCQSGVDEVGGSFGSGFCAGGGGGFFWRG